MKSIQSNTKINNIAVLNKTLNKKNTESTSSILADSQAVRDGKYQPAKISSKELKKLNIAQANQNKAAFAQLPSPDAISTKNKAKVDTADFLADSAQVRDGYQAPSLRVKLFAKKLIASAGSLLGALVGSLKTGMQKLAAGIKHVAFTAPMIFFKSLKNKEVKAGNLDTASIPTKVDTESEKSKETAGGTSAPVKSNTDGTTTDTQEG